MALKDFNFDEIGSQRKLSSLMWDLHEMAMAEGLKFEVSVQTVRRRYMRKLEAMARRLELEEKDDD